MLYNTLNSYTSNIFHIQNSTVIKLAKEECRKLFNMETCIYHPLNVSFTTHKQENIWNHSMQAFVAICSYIWNLKYFVFLIYVTIYHIYVFVSLYMRCMPVLNFDKLVKSYLRLIFTEIMRNTYVTIVLCITNNICKIFLPTYILRYNSCNPQF